MSVVKDIQSNIKYKNSLITIKNLNKIIDIDSLQALFYMLPLLYKE